MKLKNRTYVKGIALVLTLMLALAPCLGSLSVYAAVADTESAAAALNEDSDEPKADETADVTEPSPAEPTEAEKPATPAEEVEATTEPTEAAKEATTEPATEQKPQKVQMSNQRVEETDKPDTSETANFQIKVCYEPLILGYEWSTIEEPGSGPIGEPMIEHVDKAKYAEEGFEYDTYEAFGGGEIGPEHATIDLYYKRLSYPVTYVVEGLPDELQSMVPTSGPCKYGAPIDIPEKLAAKGYTFSDWQVIGLSKDKEGNYIMPARNVTITCTCTKDGTFQVKPYFQDVNGEYKLDEERISDIDGETGECAGKYFKSGSYKGFTFDENDERNKTALDTQIGSNTCINVYYTRNSHTVTYLKDDGTVYKTSSFLYEQPVSLEAGPEVAGKTFKGWSLGDGKIAEDFVMDDTDVVLKAVYEEQPQVWTYTVRYLEDSGYGMPQKVLHDPETLSVEVGSEKDKEVVVPAQKIDGYVVNDNKQTQTIILTGDPDKDVVTFQYKRCSYAVIYEVNYGDGIDENRIQVSYPAGKTYEYQQEVALDDVRPTITMPDSYDVLFNFNDLTLENGTYTMPAHDVVIKVNFTKKQTAGYEVKYHLEDLEGGNYTQEGTAKQGTGTIGQSVVDRYKAEGLEQTFTGFTFSHYGDEDAVIDEDGNTCLDVYYTRNSYDVIYTVTGGPNGDVIWTETHKYGAEVTLTNPDIPAGYTFGSWTEREGVESEGNTFTMPAGDVSVSGSFTANPITPPDPTPGPIDPAPVDPTPVDPTPVDPTPVEPVDPTPVDPTPVDPAPVDPTPVDPTPVDPTPVEPTPVDPAPATPVTPNPTPANPATPATPAAVTPAAPAAATPAAIPAVAALAAAPAAAPAAAAAPATTLADDEVPLAAGPEDNQGLETLEDGDVPLAGNIPAQWALLNLILAVLTVLASVVLLIGYFSRKREDEDGEEIEVKKKGIARVLSILPALAAVILFILTEDMSNPMVFTDKWTIWMVLIAVIEVVVAFFSKKREKDEDNNQGYGVA